jgi:hypothetical protein
MRAVPGARSWMSNTHPKPIYLGTVMLTRHTAWGDSEAGRQRQGSSWRPASDSPKAVRIGPRYITVQPEQFELRLAP